MRSRRRRNRRQRLKSQSQLRRYLNWRVGNLRTPKFRNFFHQAALRLAARHGN